MERLRLHTKRMFLLLGLALSGCSPIDSPAQTRPLSHANGKGVVAPHQNCELITAEHDNNGSSAEFRCGDAAIRLDYSKYFNETTIIAPGNVELEIWHGKRPLTDTLLDRFLPTNENPHGTVFHTIPAICNSTATYTIRVRSETGSTSELTVRCDPNELPKHAERPIPFAFQA